MEVIVRIVVSVKPAAILLIAVVGCTGHSTSGQGGDPSKPGGGDGAPAFLSTPPDRVAEGEVYLYAARAEDPDAERVRYRKVSGPDGLEVSPDNGAIFWVTGPRSAGEHTFVIEASDPGGKKVQQSAKVTVTRVNVAPRILSHAPTGASAGQGWSYKVLAEDDDGDTLSYRITKGPQGMQVVAGSSVIAFTPAAPGVYRATVEVADPDGLTASETFAVGVGTPGDVSGPQVSLTEPVESATIAGPTDVRGTITAPDLAGWTLEVCQPPGAASCREVARGLDEVPPGELVTRLDPSPLMDASAELRLTAWDASQNRVTASRIVEILATTHVGLFGVEMVDLVTRVDGVRVELGRIYDSRNGAAEDFGPGWAMQSNIGRAADSMPGAIRLMGPAKIADGYSRVPCGFNCPDDIGPPKPITLTVGNSAYVFVFQPKQQSWVDRLSVRATWNTPPGTSVTAIYEDGRPYYDGFLSAEDEGGSVALRCWESNDMFYEPPALHFDVPGKNGRFTVDIARTKGNVLRMTGTPDLGGGGAPSGPTITRDGVVGKRGVMVRFERDGMGRIVREKDDVYGTEVTFTYDGAGLLVSSTYAGGKSATFEYANGRLARYSLPDGLGLTRVDYDREGRAIRKVLPDGRILVFDYDEVARKVTVRDASGAAFVYGYDERGNIDHVTDPMGNQTLMEHDADGRMVRRVDPMGRQETWQYNAAGDLVGQSVPGEGSWHADFDAQGLPRMVVDTEGRKYTVQDDGQGRPSVIRGPDGTPVYSVTYDADNRVNSITDGPGRTTSYQFDGEGRVARVQESMGHTLDVAWSKDGLRAESVDEDGTRAYSEESPEGDIEEVGSDEGTIDYQYNLGGDLVGANTPDGPMSLDRNGAGDITAFKQGGEVVAERQYDASGRLTLLRHGGGWFERYRYNAAGQVSEKVTPEGTTTFDYDAAGLLLAQSGPEGTSRITRDQEGRPMEIADGEGHKVSFTYDAAGRPTSQVDPAGGKTQVEYDPMSGLPARVTSACGVEELSWDTRFLGPGVKDASEVPLRSRRDPSSGLWSFDNDVQGRVAAVHDPAGGVTTYGYDAEEHVAQVKDAGGGTWQFSYTGDRLASVTTPEGRRTEELPGEATLRPDGSVRRVSEDKDGAVVATYSDALSLSVLYDAEGRPLRTSSPADKVEYTWDATGHVATVKRGDGATARFERDARGRLVTVEASTPDGKKLAARYEYDAAGHISALVDPDGGRTTYEYDGASRVSAIRRPNGATTTYQYTASGRPTEILHRFPDGTTRLFAYEYDAACRRTTEATPEGTFRYGYDALGRIAQVDGPRGTTRYGWDAVGNRVRVEEPGGTTTWSFDKDGRVKSAAGPRGNTSYRYSDRGALLGSDGPDGTTGYEYDEADRLTAISRPGGERLEQRYDAEGRLVELSGGGATRRCLAVPDTGLLPLSNCIAFYGGGGPLRLTLVGPEGIAGDAGDGGTRFTHLSELGSVAALSDAKGALLGGAAYDPFGAPSSDSLPADFSFRFAGEIARGGLTFLRARWYAPALGAFTTGDEAEMTPRDPRTLHRYAYALGDPLGRVDPLGTFPLVGVMVSMGADSNMRAQNNAATMAARCYSTKKIAALVGKWVVNMMLGGMLRRLGPVLTGGLIPPGAGELAADLILRNNVFCRGGSPAPWVSWHGMGNVRFQVDVRRCGVEPAAGLSELCNNPGTKPGPFPGAQTTGIDFVLDSSGPREYGLPIELKRGSAWPEGDGTPGQLYRYCRYAARSKYKLLVYVFYGELPSQLVYARRALGCMFCWNRKPGEFAGGCGRHPAAGPLLLAMGKTRAGKFRVYYPKVAGLCSALPG